MSDEYEIDFKQGGEIPVREEGMTLRDKFAMAALQGILANPDISVKEHSFVNDDAAIAHQCYYLADWLLEARNTQEEQQ